jgi:hypothetical protein
LHLLRAEDANGEGDPDTRLPAPEQALLHRLSRAEAGELIERYIDYFEPGIVEERSVHLNPAFVDHFLKRNDRILPVVSAVSTLPLVLPSGALLCGPGLVRTLGTIFRIPPKLRDVLPSEHCTPSRVVGAMRFLTEDWLCDVTTSYAGKCVLISCGLSIIERVLLDQRPAFMVRAGQRGGGKTTTLHMLSMATLGHRAAAAAWSSNAEERRKAIFAYLIQGVAFLIWDNLPRGLAVSDATLEKVLTSESYTDRILGESSSPIVPATTIQAFTGNNIMARGDLASRVLNVGLSIDRTDPENRAYKHPDPIAWTERHRGKILRALYTLLLGNPQRVPENRKEAETRFKMWWSLVGSAVENAARESARLYEENSLADRSQWNPACTPQEISCKTLFLAGEEDDEQTDCLGDALRWLTDLQHDLTQTDKQNPSFTAQQVRNRLLTNATQTTVADNSFIEALAGAAGKMTDGAIPSVRTLTWRLKAIRDMPACIPTDAGNKVLMHLTYAPDDRVGGRFRIREVKPNG